ncbi:unnamed protein product [Sphenostylis stenocarpa]|uniref:Uncharacterized protein n=1 Tax=Sphenostylis stenocarpa TaxID=92480 RepID=A0AA86SFR0_9FABA|nr:unnamed protein product [Sphenostylis stenocarpa]
MDQTSWRFPMPIGTCPTKLFLGMLNNSKRVALEMEAGIGPEILFIPMPNCWRLGSVKNMLEGREPLNWLAPAEKKDRDDRLKSVEGSIPDSLLSAIEIKVKFLRWPSSSGTFPSKLLRPKARPRRDENFHMNEGIPPVKLFIPIDKSYSLVRKLSSMGILPTSLFPDKLNLLSSEQLDKLVQGSDPLMPEAACDSMPLAKPAEKGK